jgi:hypothetical protein
MERKDAQIWFKESFNESNQWKAWKSQRSQREREKGLEHVLRETTVHFAAFPTPISEI